MPKMTGARFIAETFKGYGVTHVFFMPVVMPGTIMEMEKIGIRCIMAHSEKPAVYMADAYARVRRQTEICMSQSVGAANLAAGLQDPWLACTPIIALTGRTAQIGQYRNAYQEVDHFPFFEAVTKHNRLVGNTEQLPFALRQAFREAASGTPGPVHLDLEHIFGDFISDGEADMEVVVEEPFTHLPPFRPEPELEKVRAALSLLTEAKRPIIVAGGGVTASQAQAEVVELAEKLAAPVATSLNAKGTILDTHPLSVGVCGSYSRSCANKAVAEADLVIFIGSRTGSQVTNEWTLLAAGTTVIQIDINPVEIGRSYATKVAMQGDAKAAVARLLANMGPQPGRAEWTQRTQQLVGEWREAVAPLANSDAVPIRPERLCREITEYLPSDAILVSDTGHAGIWTGAMIDLKYPGQTYIRCAGSLGWGLPASFGAKCAAPDRPVLCFTGDGGMWYHLPELETALRYGINTVTVVNNNHSLNQEKELFERAYGGRTPSSDALWVFSDTDFAAVARSLGCFGIRVDRPSDLHGALEQALASGKPAIVDVKTDIEGIAPPAWRPPTPTDTI